MKELEASIHRERPAASSEVVVWGGPDWRRGTRLTAGESWRSISSSDMISKGVGFGVWIGY